MSSLLYFQPDDPFLRHLNSRHRTMVPPASLPVATPTTEVPVTEPVDVVAASTSSAVTDSHRQAPRVLPQSVATSATRSNASRPHHGTSPVWNYVNPATFRCMMPIEGGDVGPDGKIPRCEWVCPSGAVSAGKQASRAMDHLKGAIPKSRKSCHGLSVEEISRRVRCPSDANCPTMKSVKDYLAAKATVSVQHYPPGHDKQVLASRLVAELIVNNGQPLSFVEYPEFSSLVMALDSKVSIVSRRTLTRTHIPSMCSQLYGIIDEILRISPAVHLSVDGWSSKMAISFLGVVAHCLVNGEPVSVLLHMMEVNAASKTAEVLQEVLYKVLIDWKLLAPRKVTGISADSACKDVKRVHLLPVIVMLLRVCSESADIKLAVQSMSQSRSAPNPATAGTSDAGLGVGQLSEGGSFDIPYCMCVVHMINNAAKAGNAVLKDWIGPLNAICKRMRKSCRATYIASTAGQAVAAETARLPTYREIVRVATDCATRFVSKAAVFHALLKHREAVEALLRDGEILVGE